MTERWTSLLIGAALLAGAVGLLALADRPGGECRVAGADWPERVAPRVPDQLNHPDLEFFVDRDDQFRMRFNGGEPAAMSKAELMTLAEELRKPGPPFLLVVRTSPTADCATIRQVRQVLGNVPACRTGSCIDGEVWDQRLKGKV